MRSRVDPSRRLTGETAAAADWRRELYPPAPDATVETARRLLTRLLDLAPAVQGGSVEASALTSLAEEALGIDPAAEDWQAVSKGLLRLRDEREATGDRLMVLNQVVARVAAVTERASLATRPLDRNRALRSAWAAERQP